MRRFPSAGRAVLVRAYRVGLKLGLVDRGADSERVAEVRLTYDSDGSCLPALTPRRPLMDIARFDFTALAASGRLDD